MNEKIAIEILKQANIETTASCCEKCPRKDKNKTCIGCLDDAKDILLNHINNLQSKIDKANKILDKYAKTEVEDYKEIIKFYKELRNALKEDK